MPLKNVKNLKNWFTQISTFISMPLSAFRYEKKSIQLRSIKEIFTDKLDSQFVIFLLFIFFFIRDPTFLSCLYEKNWFVCWTSFTRLTTHTTWKWGRHCRWIAAAGLIMQSKLLCHILVYSRHITYININRLFTFDAFLAFKRIFDCVM